LLTTVGVGLIVVFVLRGSSLFEGSRRTFGPVVDIVLGAVALLVAYLAWRGRPAHPESRAKPDRPSWTMRTLSRGALVAFVVGIVLNVIPGVLPLVALKDIAQLDYSVGLTVALVVGFYLINVGYVTLVLSTTANLTDLRHAIELVCDKVGVVLLVLGIMHFFNLLVLHKMRRRGQEYANNRHYRPADLHPAGPHPGKILD
jgi:thiol:disulfide interchange protein